MSSDPEKVISFLRTELISVEKEQVALAARRKKLKKALKYMEKTRTRHAVKGKSLPAK